MENSNNHNQRIQYEELREQPFLQTLSSNKENLLCQSFLKQP